jgi:hypothetical protein
MAHMLQNIGAVSIEFTQSELTELNAAVRAVETKGQRLPDEVLAFSGVEAAPKPNLTSLSDAHKPLISKRRLLRHLLHWTGAQVGG